MRPLLLPVLWRAGGGDGDSAAAPLLSVDCLPTQTVADVLARARDNAAELQVRSAAVAPSAKRAHG